VAGRPIRFPKVYYLSCYQGIRKELNILYGTKNKKWKRKKKQWKKLARAYRITVTIKKDIMDVDKIIRGFSFGPQC
jgi:hypothetical protein